MLSGSLGWFYVDSNIVYNDLGSLTSGLNIIKFSLPTDYKTDVPRIYFGNIDSQPSGSKLSFKTLRFMR